MTRKPFQSKLIPHLEFIRECRANQLSYPRIAADLRARFGLAAAPSTIFAFVKVRARQRPMISLPQRDTTAAPTTRSAPSATHPPTGRPTAPGNWLNYDPAKPLEKLQS